MAWVKVDGFGKYTQDELDEAKETAENSVVLNDISSDTIELSNGQNYNIDIDFQSVDSITTSNGEYIRVDIIMELILDGNSGLTATSSC